MTAATQLNYMFAERLNGDVRSLATTVNILTFLYEKTFPFFAESLDLLPAIADITHKYTLVTITARAGYYLRNIG